MDHQTFQIIAAVFAILISTIGALVMLWVKSIERAQAKHQQRADDLLDHINAVAEQHHDQTGKLLERINSVAIEVARNYMPRSELEKKLDSIFGLLEEIRKEVRHA